MNARTVFLARLIGLFLVVFSLALLVQRGSIAAALYRHSSATEVTQVTEVWPSSGHLDTT
jgi:hypothetical protein